MPEIYHTMSFYSFFAFIICCILLTFFWHGVLISKIIEANKFNLGTVKNVFLELNKSNTTIPLSNLYIDTNPLKAKIRWF